MNRAKLDLLFIMGDDVIEREKQGMISPIKAHIELEQINHEIFKELNETLQQQELKIIRLEKEKRELIYAHKDVRNAHMKKLLDYEDFLESKGLQIEFGRYIEHKYSSVATSGNSGMEEDTDD